MTKNLNFFILFLLLGSATGFAQQANSLLILNHIYNSSEFKSENQSPIFWIENNNAFGTIKKNTAENDKLIRYQRRNYWKSVYFSAEKF